MQEDIENRTINFAISTTKLTGRTLLAAARKFLQWRAGKAHSKPVGKQSVKQLLRQDQGATNIEIEKTGIRDFKRILDKYGVDYAITKNHDTPPRYVVFFKARDADTLTAAFKDYSAKLVNKEKRPSVHPLDLMVGLCCGAGLRLAVYLKGKNDKKYRHGSEYGSARWSA